MDILYNGQWMPVDQYYAAKNADQTQAARSAQGTQVNNGGTISNTGGAMPPSMMGLNSATGYSSGASAGSAGGGGVFVPQAGKPMLTQGGYEKEDQMRLGAELSANAFNTRLTAVNGMSGSAGSGTPAQAYDPAAAEAARAAAFARAKDTAGQLARSNVDTLSNIMSERGLLGSGLEAAGLASITDRSAGRLNDFNREQLLQDLKHAESIDSRNFDASQAGLDRDAQTKRTLLSLVSSGGGIY